MEKFDLIVIGSGPAGSAAVPDQTAEPGYSRHPRGPDHDSVHGVRGADEGHEPGAGRGISGDGGDAGRD